MGNWANLFNASDRGNGVPLAIKVLNTGEGNLETNKLPTLSSNNNKYSAFFRNDQANGTIITNTPTTATTPLSNTAIFTDGNVVANQFQSLGNSAALSAKNTT